MLKLNAKINLLVISIILFLSITVCIAAIEKVSTSIKDFAIHKAKGDLRLSYHYIDSKYKGDWAIKNGKLYKGSTLMNDNEKIVDQIGNDTNDTITIFQGNTRIATNVWNQGQRIIGTKVSPVVEKTVLKEGRNYYGEANVAGKMHQTAYMPLRDKNGKIIGILYVGADQSVIDRTIHSFLVVFSIVLITAILLSL
ncbi:MAG: cache domain-containing protein, partial [Bacillales bacterium]|nr:cache domain-containing protein [Bacillales bacterium]